MEPILGAPPPREIMSLLGMLPHVLHGDYRGGSSSVKDRIANHLAREMRVSGLRSW